MLARSIIVLALLAPGALAAQQNAADSVFFLDAGWAHAYKSHDTTFAKRLFAADLVVTSANGNLKNREQELNDIRPSPTLRMDSFKTDSVQFACTATRRSSRASPNGASCGAASRRLTGAATPPCTRAVARCAGGWWRCTWDGRRGARRSATARVDPRTS